MEDEHAVLICDLDELARYAESVADPENGLPDAGAAISAGVNTVVGGFPTADAADAYITEHQQAYAPNRWHYVIVPLHRAGA